MILSTVGVNITKHYCGGIVSDVYFSYQTEHCGGGMDDMGCCMNEHDRYVLDNDYQYFSFSYDFTQAPVELRIQYLELEKLVALQADTDRPDIYFKAAPPTSWPDIYTRVQSFLL